MRRGFMDAKTKQKKSVQLSPSHLTVFLLIYLGDILLFLALRGYFFLVMGIFFTVSVPLSLCMAWFLAEHITSSIACELPSGEHAIRQSEQALILFSMTNTSWLCALNGTWLLSAGNSFYGTSNQQKLQLSIPPHGKKQFQLTVTVTDLGRIAFTCRKFWITDLFGIFMIHTDCSTECDFFVLPKTDDIVDLKLPDAYSGAAELSESQRKGSDYTEVSDIRTYVPGDRPRDIHWKLSARQGELMVKERVSLSGSEHILLLELPPEKEQAEKLLKDGYHKIKGLMANHMAVRLLVWNNPTFTFEAYSCTSVDELEAAYCEIFQTDLLSHSSGLMQQYMKNCFPQLESYLCLTQREDTVQLEMYVNG